MTGTLRVLPALAFVVVSACQTNPPRTMERINADLEQASEQKVTPEAVSQALLPPVVVEMPKADARPKDQRFDLVVNNAPASQVFMAIVSGTRYSMVVHSNMKEPLSLNLRDISVFEALDAIRDLYGYEYKVQGSRITVQPLTLQTKVFYVNYLMEKRKGKSEVRISSGAVTDMAATAQAGTAQVTVPPGGTGVARALESSKVETTSEQDFWTDITTAVTSIVGQDNGRQVVVNRQAGVVMVRAMPAEIRQVAEFIKSMENAVVRQVVLEVKIIEVQLRDGFETGVNWAAFTTGSNSRFAGGVIRPATTLSPTGTLVTPTNVTQDGKPELASLLTSDPASPGFLTALPQVPGTLFGLAFQTSSFATILSFLETQGDLQVLSSPRLAALNNQKAVLKVGTDDFFVTGVSGNTSTTVVGGISQTTPSITFQPFFSGVALDITPQIDEVGQITLHVHPSVSRVTSKQQNIDLGTSGIFRIPLASSDIRESDTIVRVSDGNVAAIGGLMDEITVKNKSQVPVIGNVPIIGNLFKNTASRTVKSELVILIKPTVVLGESTWRQEAQDARNRIQALSRGGSAEAPAQGQPRAAQ